MEELEVFYASLKKEVAVSASANGIYHQLAFMNEFVEELTDLGDIQGFNDCDNPKWNGAYINGFDAEENEETESIRIDLFITDYEQRENLERLGKTDIDLFFKRLLKFFTESLNHELYTKIDESNTAYRIAEYIEDNKEKIEEVNLFFFSERAVGEKVTGFNREELDKVNIKYHLWDINRFAKLKNSSKKKEPIEIDFVEKYNAPLDCLRASTATEKMDSYLVVVPGIVLANLYNDYGARLLEQNVRSFLQAKGGVNKGIRRTIIDEPEYFFSYNNGITATAAQVETSQSSGGLKISKLVDLQIVNGGQTTASLARAKIRDTADLAKIFVQMKLSIINHDGTDEGLISRISQYANTQNKVNASDLSANHPYHVKLEELSRKIWAAPVPPNHRATQWFYERSRGQYSEQILKEGNIGKLKYPKHQLFNKTDLAKFMMTWDSDEPKWVNMGAQKNFVKFTEMINNSSKKTNFQDSINELYYKKIVSRAIIFKTTEKLVQKQSWYTNGYRANIVIYTLAFISYYLKKNDRDLNYAKIWANQKISEAFEKLIKDLSEKINNILIDTNNPSRTTSNISEWAKKDACWAQMTGMYYKRLSESFDTSFANELIDAISADNLEVEAARKEKVNAELAMQDRINGLGKQYWFSFLEYLENRVDLGFKEKGVLQTTQRQKSSLTLKQCYILNNLIERYGEGFEKYQKVSKF